MNKRGLRFRIRNNLHPQFWIGLAFNATDWLRIFFRGPL